MEKQKQNKTEKIIKALRFLIGLAAFIWLLWLGPKLVGQDPLVAVMLYAIFPMIIFSLPAVIIGLYFVATKKFRMRLDVVFVLILIFLLSGLERYIVPEQPSGDISGDAKLEITLLKENNVPISKVEVDVGEKPGTPPKGGRQMTNSNGVVDFSVKPGEYVIYFNDSSFPRDAAKPIKFPKINVEEGKLNTKTVILNSK